MWGLPLICQPSSEGDDGLSGSHDTGTSVLEKTCVSREPAGPESLGSAGKTWAGMALGRQQWGWLSIDPDRPWLWALPAPNLAETDMTRWERWPDRECLGEADKVACPPGAAHPVLQPLGLVSRGPEGVGAPRSGPLSALMSRPEL